LSAYQKKSVAIMNNISQYSKNLLSSFKPTPPSAAQNGGVFGAPEIPTEDEVHIAVSPLLSFLDANLGVMAETMPDGLARRVVIRLWERVLDVALTLLVPTLGGDEKDKKPWDEGRVVFLKYTIEVSFKIISPPFFLSPTKSFWAEPCRISNPSSILKEMVYLWSYWIQPNPMSISV
jgi:hypothetical protein